MFRYLFFLRKVPWRAKRWWKQPDSMSTQWFCLEERCGQTMKSYTPIGRECPDNKVSLLISYEKSDPNRSLEQSVKVGVWNLILSHFKVFVFPCSFSVCGLFSFSFSFDLLERLQTFCFESRPCLSAWLQHLSLLYRTPPMGEGKRSPLVSETAHPPTGITRHWSAA